jgi:hypothetical protein
LQFPVDIRLLLLDICWLIDVGSHCCVGEECSCTDTCQGGGSICRCCVVAVETKTGSISQRLRKERARVGPWFGWGYHKMVARYYSWVYLKSVGSEARGHVVRNGGGRRRSKIRNPSHGTWCGLKELISQVQLTGKDRNWDPGRKRPHQVGAITHSIRSLADTCWNLAGPERLSDVETSKRGRHRRCSTNDCGSKLR